MRAEYLKTLIDGHGPGLRKAARSFLCDIWSAYEPASYTFLCTRRSGTNKWREHAINGGRKRQIREVLERYPTERYDVYFCPNAFFEPRRMAKYAMPTRYGWCDIDGDDPAKFDPSPNVLWETSPRRYQGIWIWNKDADGDVAEQYSRNIWRLNGGDAGGWSVTKALRVPGTINHKPAYQSPRVRLLKFKFKPQVLPDDVGDVRTSRSTFESTITVSTPHDPLEVMRRYRRSVGMLAGALMTASRALKPDRSRCVFVIVVALAKCGASDDEIASVLLVNPYFTGKWGVDMDQAQRQIHMIRQRMDVSR